MNILPTTTTLYYLLIFVFLSSFTTLILIFLYSFYTWLVTRKKNVIYKQLYEVNPSDAAYKKSLQILEEARGKALNLLKDFKNEKDNIQEEYKDIRLELSNTLTDKLRYIGEAEQRQATEISSKLMNELSTSLQKEKDATVNIIHDLSSSLKTSVLQELDEFTTLLQKSTIDSKALIEKYTQEEYQKANEVIERYKQDAIKSIEEKLRVNLNALLVDMLHKTMTNEDQETLVRSSLLKLFEDSEFKSL